MVVAVAANTFEGLSNEPLGGDHPIGEARVYTQTGIERRISGCMVQTNCFGIVCRYIAEDAIPDFRWQTNIGSTE